MYTSILLLLPVLSLAQINQTPPPDADTTVTTPPIFIDPSINPSDATGSMTIYTPLSPTSASSSTIFVDPINSANLTILPISTSPPIVYSNTKTLRPIESTDDSTATSPPIYTDPEGSGVVTILPIPSTTTGGGEPTFTSRSIFGPIGGGNGTAVVTATSVGGGGPVSTGLGGGMSTTGLSSAGVSTTVVVGGGSSTSVPSAGISTTSTPAGTNNAERIVGGSGLIVAVLGVMGLFL